MKHIFIKIDLKICGDEVLSNTILSIRDEQDEYLAAKEYVKNFWGDGEEEEGSEWVTYPNDNLGRLRHVETLTNAEYEVLKRFIWNFYRERRTSLY